MLARKVWSLERFAALEKRASLLIEELGIKNVAVLLEMALSDCLRRLPSMHHNLGGTHRHSPALLSSSPRREESLSAPKVHSVIKISRA